MRQFFASFFALAISAGAALAQQGLSAPHVATESALAGYATAAYPNGVWRDDYATGYGAPPLFYTPSGSACSLNSGAGDGGSQVKSSDGKCWIARLPSTADVREWGAAPGALSDATTAVIACLTAMGAGNTCEAAGFSVLISGAVVIPAHETLSCGKTALDAEDSPSAYASVPAIELASSQTIEASGEGASVLNCLIWRAGMTFPVTNPSTYAGVALEDAGYGNFTARGNIIIGFDTCIWVTGTRPALYDDYVDCTGVSHPAIYLDNGNTDSGYAWRLKLQPLGSGNANCTASVRAGTGFGTGGSGGPVAYIGDIISQNFLTADFDFEVSAYAGGTLWADGINGTGAGCGSGGYGSSIGVKIGVGSSLEANNVDINEVNVGWLSLSTGAVSRANLLSFTAINSDCVQLGNSSDSGNLHVGTVIFGGCGGYAVDVEHVNAEFIVGTKATASNVNSGSAPYFNAASGVTATIGPGGNFSIADLQTNLAAGTNPFYAYDGSKGFVILNSVTNPISAFLVPSLSNCTGTGISCAFVNDENINFGAVLLTCGSSCATTGSVDITAPITGSQGFNVCNLTQPPGLETAWPSGSSDAYTAVSATEGKISWTFGATPTNGDLYVISFWCSYF